MNQLLFVTPTEPHIFTVHVLVPQLQQQSSFVTETVIRKACAVVWVRLLFRGQFGEGAAGVHHTAKTRDGSRIVHSNTTLYLVKLRWNKHSFITICLLLHQPYIFTVLVLVPCTNLPMWVMSFGGRYIYYIRRSQMSVFGRQNDLNISVFYVLVFWIGLLLSSGKTVGSVECNSGNSAR